MNIQVHFHFTEPKKCEYCGEELPAGNEEVSQLYCDNSCKNRVKESVARKRKKEFVDSFKIECELCGYDKFKGALDFHHKNPEEKTFAVSRYEKYSYERIEAEIDKCMVLCSNCHREIHGETSLIGNP